MHALMSNSTMLTVAYELEISYVGVPSNLKDSTYFDGDPPQRRGWWNGGNTLMFLLARYVVLINDPILTETSQINNKLLKQPKEIPSKLIGVPPSCLLDHLSRVSRLICETSHILLCIGLMLSPSIAI